MQRLVRGKPCPVLPVDFLIRSPFRVLCDKCVFAADDFALEVRRETWVVFGKPYGALVAR
jgi:hypothetical protein